MSLNPCSASYWLGQGASLTPCLGFFACKMGSRSARLTGWLQALNKIDNAFGSEFFRLGAQEIPAVRREPPGRVSASWESCPHLPPSLPCPRPQRSWGMSSPPAHFWGTTGASGSRPAPPCSPPGLRCRHGPRRPETRPRRRTRSSAGHTWGRRADRAWRTGAPPSRPGAQPEGCPPAFPARGAAGGGAPFSSSQEPPSVSPHSLLGGHPHPMSRGRGPREGKARASKVPQPRSGRNRTGRPLKTQTQPLEMEQDSRVVYRACS